MRPSRVRNIEIRQARAAGESLVSIGARFGITRQRVAQIVRDGSSTVPKPAAVRRRDEIARAAGFDSWADALVDTSDMTGIGAAALLGVSHSLIYRQRREAGIASRRYAPRT